MAAFRSRRSTTAMSRPSGASLLMPCTWDGSDPAVGGVYGQRESIVIVTGPANMLCNVGGSTGNVPGAISGGTLARSGAWADIGSCIADRRQRADHAHRRARRSTPHPERNASDNGEAWQAGRRVASRVELD